MNIFITIIPIDLVTNSLSSFSCLFLQSKNPRFSASWWSGNNVLYFKATANSIDFYEFSRMLFLFVL